MPPNNEVTQVTLTLRPGTLRLRTLRFGKSTGTQLYRLPRDGRFPRATHVVQCMECTTFPGQAMLVCLLVRRVRWRHRPSPVLPLTWTQRDFDIRSHAIANGCRILEPPTIWNSLSTTSIASGDGARNGSRKGRIRVFV